MDFNSVLLGPNYELFGVDVVLTISGQTYPTTFIDKTAGASLGGPVEIETTRPAATARVADLILLGLTVDDLEEAAVAMNGNNWRVMSTRPVPSPNGEADGEVYMFLQKI